MRRLNVENLQFPIVPIDDVPRLTPSLLSFPLRMAAQKLFATLLIVTMVLLTIFNDKNTTEARYLPTRSSSDRIDKLKELLKELLENEIEKEEYQSADPAPRWHPDRKLFYKREIPSQ